MKNPKVKYELKSTMIAATKKFMEKGTKITQLDQKTLDLIQQFTNEYVEEEAAKDPMFKKVAKAQLLVVDDWGLSKLDDQRYRDILEILDDRQGVGATLITSQFPVDHWHETIPDPTVADAILDRLIHGSHRIELEGESMRKRKRKNA